MHDIPDGMGGVVGTATNHPHAARWRTHGGTEGEVHLRILPFRCLPRHSTRIASDGSTRVARRAGIRHASAPVAPSVKITAPNTVGSSGFTS